MSNKESCRGCGFCLIPFATCNICQEYVSWICCRCERIDDCNHIHNYCRIVYRKRIESNLFKTFLYEAIIEN